MEEIAGADHMHGKKVCKDLEIKHLEEYHNFYLKSHTLILADAFENLGKISLRIYQLEPAIFFLPLGLEWKAALKKVEVKLGLLTDINMLSMVTKGIKGGYIIQLINM